MLAQMQFVNSAATCCPFCCQLSCTLQLSITAPIRIVFDTGCLFIKKSSVLAKQSGCQDVVNVKSSRQLSTSVSQYLHLNPALAQSQNITLCQHNASKFDIVQRCCCVLVWIPWPKDDILPVLLDEAADIVEGLAEAVPSKLPKRQAGHLKGYANHVLRPCWKSNHPEWYEEMYRRQRPNLVHKMDAVCAAVTALKFR